MLLVSLRRKHLHLFACLVGNRRSECSLKRGTRNQITADASLEWTPPFFCVGQTPSLITTFFAIKLIRSET